MNFASAIISHNKDSIQSRSILFYAKILEELTLSVLEALQRKGEIGLGVLKTKRANDFIRINEGGYKHQYVI